jgi:hypothetical protein
MSSKLDVLAALLCQNYLKLRTFLLNPGGPGNLILCYFINRLTTEKSAPITVFLPRPGAITSLLGESNKAAFTSEQHHHLGNKGVKLGLKFSPTLEFYTACQHNQIHFIFT